MAKYPLKAILIGISEGGEQSWLAARGETMTGVAAAPDMRFRNGAVAITYLGTLLLLLPSRAWSIDDPVAKWFPDYPKADEGRPLRSTIRPPPFLSRCCTPGQARAAPLAAPSPY